MIKIPIKKWSVQNSEGKEIEENLLMALNVLVSNTKPEDLPRGFEQFKLFRKLIHAFEDAQKTNILSLEHKEYVFLKNIVSKEIPMQWAGNENIVEAIELFMNAKDEGVI